MGNAASAPSQIISLPQGGGAQRGIGESFAPDLHTGTGNFTVPIALPPGRNGFQPELSLVYSTGNGNGPFGLGWSLSVPGISRKTAKGVPRYQDRLADPSDRDTFVLSGAEDLVPVPGEADDIVYRPRTEGLFARIERRTPAGEDYWEVRGKDGLVSFYGTPRPQDADDAWRDPATLADPSDARHIFAWRLSRTEDLFGNQILYDYLTDADNGDLAGWTQSYLQRVRYIDYAEDGGTRHLVSVTLDYEPRPDAFSDHRAGFEIRTRLRCSAIIIRTHAGPERLVRTYRLRYAEAPLNGVLLLRSVEVVGWDGVDRLPPLEFGYSSFDPSTRRDLFPVSGEEPPVASLARPDYELADLNGDGLPDVLEMNGTVRYWRNLGGGRFDRPRPMRDTPAGVALADPGVQLLDADGDGRIDLVVTQNGLSGYYPLRFDGRWDRASFRRYRQAPSTGLEGPEIRLVDLDGDGVTDALRSGTRLECFFNRPREGGWEGPHPAQRWALEAFPNVTFDDPRVKVADLSGDGLQDIALVHDGSVEYWPSLGHGRWGPRVRMKHSPHFRFGYDPRRILIGDVDGDGLADIVYVDDQKVTLWINQSGAAWSHPVEIPGTPPVSDLDAVRLVDLLGSGISGVLWSADTSGQRPSMYFLDLTGAAKPYLLQRMDNHLGAVTLVEYAPSTTCYLADQTQPETRWRTPLPFPVQVVRQAEVIDAISKGKRTTEYRYHHGYWDGGEREFRGFAMVEQLDSEDLETYRRPGLHGDGVAFTAVEQPARFSPPTLTKTWFDVGPIGDEVGGWESLDLTHEYWQEDPPTFGRHASVTAVLGGLGERRHRRDALRALRGRILRTELYALDDSPRRDRPYSVTESRYGLREESPPGPDEGSRPRIFFPFAVAQRTTQWERGDDPMTQFAFTDDYDDVGQPTAQTTVALPRRSARRRAVTGAVVGMLNGHEVNETRILASHLRTEYATPDDGLYLHDRVAHVRTFELVDPPGVAEQDPDLAAVLQDQATAAEGVRQAFRMPLDSWQPGDVIPAGLRLIGHTLNHYDGGAGGAFEGRDAGEVGPYGALTRTETLVFTDTDLDAAYDDRRPVYLGGAMALPQDTPANFGADLGYRREQASASGYHDGYYADTVRQRLDVQTANAAQRRGVILATQDPLQHQTEITPDRFWLLPAAVTDPVGLTIAADYDERALQPRKVTDENGNATRYAYSPLGLLSRVVLQGRNGEGGSDQRPEVAHTCDFHAYDRTRDDSAPQPIFVHTTQRVWHARDGVSDETLETREYSDGFGRLLQKRVQAEEIIFGPDGNDTGLLVDGDPVPGQVGGPAIGRREADGVVVSGWQVYNNKGQVIEQYEPFFDTGWEYQPEEEARQGQRVAIFYDPRGQVVRTLNPDGSEQRVVFGVPSDLEDPETFAPTPWESYSYDANDLAPLSGDPVESLPDGSPRPLADRAPVAHHFTPTSAILDGQGRAICRVERDGPNSVQDWFVTRFAFDVRGNLLEVWDALGRVAFGHAYDLQNRSVRVASIDAGLRTTVLDAGGNPVEYRDSKGSAVLRQYDARNRLTQLWARDAAAAPVTLRERLVYGDGSAANRRRNRVGRLYRHYDEAGLLQFDRYDFKGNRTEKARRTIKNSALAAGWTADWAPAGSQNALEAASAAYRVETRYDALNRPVRTTYPRQAADRARAVVTGHYGRSGALKRVELDGVAYVEHIARNARGQRLLIAYGNGVMTRYAYDPQTFRLARLRSERFQRPPPAADEWRGQGAPLQELTYSYDLAGNVTSIEDRTPGCGVAGSQEGRHRLTRRFAYDPLYRLTQAKGRVCKDLAAPRSIEDRRACGFHPPPTPPVPSVPDQTNAPDQTWRYTETCTYDPVGNLLELVFTAPFAPPNARTWRRAFGIGGLRPDEWVDAPSNRLTRLEQGADAFTYGFDDSGNVIRQNTERQYRWDHADRLVGFTNQPPSGAQPSVEARYLYGADGMRIKKWTRRNGIGSETARYASMVSSSTTSGKARPAGGKAEQPPARHGRPGPGRADSSRPCPRRRCWPGHPVPPSRPLG